MQKRLTRLRQAMAKDGISEGRRHALEAEIDRLTRGD